MEVWTSSVLMAAQREQQNLHFAQRELSEAARTSQWVGPGYERTSMGQERVHPSRTGKMATGNAEAQLADQQTWLRYREVRMAGEKTRLQFAEVSQACKRCLSCWDIDGVLWFHVEALKGWWKIYILEWRNIRSMVFLVCGIQSTFWGPQGRISIVNGSYFV